MIKDINKINKQLSAPFTYKICVMFADKKLVYMFLYNFINSILINKKIWSGDKIQSNYLINNNQGTCAVWVFLDIDNNTMHVLSEKNIKDVIDVKDIYNKKLIKNGHFYFLLKKSFGLATFKDLKINTVSYNIKKISHIICFHKRIYDKFGYTINEKETGNIIDAALDFKRTNYFHKKIDKVKIKNYLTNISNVKHKNNIKNTSK